MKLKERILGLIFGQAVGDALGKGTEFLTAKQAAVMYPQGINSYKEIKHNPFEYLPGDYTDDTEMMLLILDSLLEKQSLDLQDIAVRFADWACNDPKDIGATTANVLCDPDYLKNPLHTAEFYWDSSGKKNAANGALMRTSILGAWDYLNTDQAVKNSALVSKLTHAAPQCAASCAGFCAAIACLFQGITDSEEILLVAKNQSAHYHSEAPSFIQLGFDRNFTEMALDNRQSMGYTYKTLAAGFTGLSAPSFQKGLQEIILAAGDADTNAAVAGAMMGARFGIDAIPHKWIRGLTQKSFLKKKADLFYNLVLNQ